MEMVYKENSTMPHAELTRRVEEFFKAFTLITSFSRIGVRGWRSGEVRLFPYEPTDTSNQTLFHNKIRAIRSIDGRTEIDIPINGTTTLNLNGKYYEVRYEFHPRA